MYGKDTLHPYGSNFFRAESGFHQATELHFLFVECRITPGQPFMKVIEGNINVVVEVVPPCGQELVSLQEIQLVEFFQQLFTFLLLGMFQHGDLLGYFQFLKDQRFGFVLYVFQFLQCFDAGD